MIKPFKVYLIKTNYDNIMSVHSSLEIAREVQSKYEILHPSWTFLVREFVLDEEWEG